MSRELERTPLRSRITQPLRVEEIRRSTEPSHPPSFSPHRGSRWLWKAIYSPLRRAQVLSWCLRGKKHEIIIIKNKISMPHPHANHQRDIPRYVHIQVCMFKGIFCWSALEKSIFIKRWQDARIDLMNADSCPAAACNPLRIIEPRIGETKKRRSGKTPQVACNDSLHIIP